MTNLKQACKKHLWGTFPYYLYKAFCPNSEKIQYFKYFKDHGYTRYPYDFAKTYMDMNIEVKTDDANGFRYIEHHGSKKLYFPTHIPSNIIAKLYRYLMLEQDTQCPHHYVDSVTEFQGKTLLDIGAAEGIIALDAIEAVDFVYLFECDPRWIEVLEITFAPWKEKVQIIKRFVNDKNDAVNQSLDDFFKDKPKDNLFLKMDIEGEERNVLIGAKRLFSEASNLDFAVCVYHRKDDEKVISSILKSYNCDFARRKGLFHVWHSLRPGVIRGRKE